MALSSISLLEVAQHIGGEPQRYVGLVLSGATAQPDVIVPE